MRPAVSRRDFLQLAGASAAAVLGATSLGATSLAGCGSFDDLTLGGSVENGSKYPSRLDHAYRRVRPGTSELQQIGWEAATDHFAEILQRYPAHQIAFLIGLYPDHLNHLVQQTARLLGGAAVLRYDPLADLDGRVSLQDAAQRLFGLPRIPLFDPSAADLTLSIGGDFQEPWIARQPASDQTRTFTGLQKPSGARWVVLSARHPSFKEIDEWIPITPGSEGLLAQALHKWLSGGSVDQRSISSASGISRRNLSRLASHLERSQRLLCIPGRFALACPNGVAAAGWIMALNLLKAASPDSPAFFLPPEPPIFPELPSRPSTAAELSALAGRILSKQVKVLVVHGVDPIAGLPAGSTFLPALTAVDHLISLSPNRDTISSYADLLLPDQPSQASFGYHLPISAADYGLVQILLPDSLPSPACRPSVGVLIHALQRAGFTDRMPYQNDLQFLRYSITRLIDRGGTYNAADPEDFYRLWFRQRSWRRERPVRFPAVAFAQPAEISSDLPSDQQANIFRLQIVPTDDLTSRAKPACVEIHPISALRLGVAPGDNIQITSSTGQISIPAALNFRLHPHVLALRWQVSHPAANEELLKLVGAAETSSGTLAYQAVSVRLKS